MYAQRRTDNHVVYLRWYIVLHMSTGSQTDTVPGTRTVPGTHTVPDTGSSILCTWYQVTIPVLLLVVYLLFTLVQDIYRYVVITILYPALTCID